MKKMIAATIIFLLTSNLAYGAENSQKITKEKSENEMPRESEYMSEESEVRNPASDDGVEVSLTEQHYLIYE